MRVVIIDTETTGLEVFTNDRIIEIAAVEIVNGKLTDNHFQAYIDPDYPIHPKAQKVHGITNKFLIGKPSFHEVIDSFVEFCSGADELSFYNRWFDKGALRKEFSRAGVSFEKINNIYSTCLMLAVSKKDNPKAKNISLNKACERYGVDIKERIESKHGALLDARLTAQLYIHFHIEKRPAMTVKKRRSTQSERAKAPKFIVGTRPIPRSYKDPVSNQMIQLNFCKNPNCENYGVPALNPKLNPDGTPKRGLGNSYAINRNENRGADLRCKLCGSITIMLSNRAFVEEVNRLKRIHRNQPICCPDKAFGKTRRKNKCRNTKVSFLDKPDRYNLKDKNIVKRERRKIMMSQRLECRACKGKFFVPTFGEHKQSHWKLNERIFEELVGKGVINRIYEMLRKHGCSRKLIYNKIDFIHRQCVEFDSWQVRQNLDRLKGKSLSLSMDRQHYLVNWNDKDIKKPSKIVNTTTTDNESGFTFACTLNFDYEADTRKIIKDSIKVKDHEKQEWRRKYARYVVSNDQIDEDDDDDTLEANIPQSGMLIKQTYSAMAHVEMMKPFYETMEHASLYADDDSGFELSIALVLKDLIKSGKVFPVLVREDKNNGSSLQDAATRHETRKEMFEEQNLSLDSLKGLKGEDFKKEMARLTKEFWVAKASSGQPEKSEWLVHPFPSANRVLEVKPLINIFADANHSMWQPVSGNGVFEVSTKGVDNHFQSIRRRINMLERPVTSATNRNRWNGYASYNPKWSVKLIEIFRVFMNYIHTDGIRLEKQGKSQDFIRENETTPAKRLGLVDKNFTMKDILEFSAAKETILEKRI
ncbi:exonuclease domain-containing protein [Vibrio natriegens]|uniref:exonuclease domain-containing protein n=1 Tax=Vibrio natriegens TaxID=691 RepID=UPI003D9FE7A0